jgi:sugar lactone lactonase YvrE
MVAWGICVSTFFASQAYADFHPAPVSQAAEKTTGQIEPVFAFYDGTNRLWMLDTAAPSFGTPIVGGAKLVGVDLASNKVVRTILFPPDVVLRNTYLNDVRFDLRQGKGGIAYITDSGASGIIVVDLASGRSWRRLTGDRSTVPDASFVPFVEGDPLAVRLPGKSPTPWQIASDGLEADSEGRVYATDYEHNAIRVRAVDGSWTTLVHDPRVLWPDTLSLAANGYLYFTSNQWERMPMMHGGTDLRKKAI